MVFNSILDINARKLIENKNRIDLLEIKEIDAVICRNHGKIRYGKSLALKKSARFYSLNFKENKAIVELKEKIEFALFIPLLI